MTTALNLLSGLSFFVAFATLLWLVWTHDSRPVLENSAAGTAARSPRGGEASTGARCTCQVYDQDEVTA